MYEIPYSATFECTEGHHFEAPVGAFDSQAETRCPICFEAWIAANVPNGRQVTKATAVDHKTTTREL